jgi:hypothetical protein
MAIVPDRWALLRVRFEGPFVVARLTDSEGGRTRAHWEGPFAWPSDALGRVAERLRGLMHVLPLARPGPHNTGPVPLALFVDLPGFLWSDPPRCDGFLWPLSLIHGDRLQVVGFAGSLRRRRPTFTLPFDVVAHGALAQLAVQGVGSAPWAQDPLVQHLGFTTLDVDEHDDEALERTLRERDRDVLVTGDTAEAVETSRALPLAARPRMIVSLDPSPVVRPPAGTALVHIGPVPEAVQTILYGLVHDLPLHEALKAALRMHPSSPLSARLFADPWTNQSLRIRDALIALQAEAEGLETSLPQVGLAPFLDRAYAQAGDQERATIGKLRERLRPKPALGAGPAPVQEPLERFEAVLAKLQWVRASVAPLRSLPRNFEDFEQEGQGLVPMARNANDLRDLSGQAARAATSMGGALDEDLSLVLREHQERVVDVALQRLETSPLLSSLDRRTTLQAGALYRLRVHIGNPLPDSLVVGPQPPIDPLLPEPEAAGHVLDVVVQGKDFDVVGERAFPLRLPRFGGSQPVYFGVRAPPEPGPAALRVHVYYQNHLVHSYLLEAEVATDGETSHSAEEVLRVVLTYAPVGRLASLDSTGSRTLSIGANAGPNATHELIVKSTGSTGELTLFPSTFEPQVEKFLRELERASRDARNPNQGRVYATVPSGSPASPEAAEVLRSLARQGSDLYSALKNRVVSSSAKLARAFQSLRSSRNEKIQIVRHDPNFVFPWKLLYDFRLPETTDQDPPVCLGSVVNAGTVQPCGHAFDSGVYCVNGFWCVRHQMEELIRREKELVGPVARPARAAVRLVGSNTLYGYSDLEQALTNAIGAPHLSTGPTVEAHLIDLLWAEPPERPAILIVLGHLDSQAIAGIPDSPGIVLQPAAEWLTQRRFDDRVYASWDQQRPVVMLMACESATTTVETVNNFVTSFHAAGAAAIIGAEAVVPSNLAADCARELTKALWGSATGAKTTLGEAMTAFRRSTLATGNPLAFVFHVFGSVDLVIQ